LCCSDEKEKRRLSRGVLGWALGGAGLEVLVSGAGSLGQRLRKGEVGLRAEGSSAALPRGAGQVRPLLSLRSPRRIWFRTSSTSVSS